MTSPTPTISKPLISKTLGALLGVHAGDSLGATHEFLPWSQIIRTYPHGLREIVGGGMLDWPAGHATDDTDLTRAVLLAYRDYEVSMISGVGKAEDFDIAKAAADYAVKWNEGDWPGRKKGRRPIDIGNATEQGLRSYRQHKDPARSGAGVGSAGNGSLMRCIPTALFGGSRERRIKESLAVSAFTHNDRRCTVACAAYNEIVAGLLEGETVGEAVERGKIVADELGCEEVRETIVEGERLDLVRMANEGPSRDDGVRKFNPTGYVLHSLTIAITAVLDERGFEDVLVDVVRLGGDSDTNGAIAGGLLGARDGVEKIPERWLEKLQFRGEFVDVGMAILDMKYKGVSKGE